MKELTNAQVLAPPYGNDTSEWLDTLVAEDAQSQEFTEEIAQIILNILRKAEDTQLLENGPTAFVMHPRDFKVWQAANKRWNKLALIADAPRRRRERYLRWRRHQSRKPIY